MNDELKNHMEYLKSLDQKDFITGLKILICLKKFKVVLTIDNSIKIFFDSDLSEAQDIYGIPYSNIIFQGIHSYQGEINTYFKETFKNKMRDFCMNYYKDAETHVFLFYESTDKKLSFDDLTNEINQLEKRLLELKKERSRLSANPPIKLVEGENKIFLKNNNNKKWLISEIKCNNKNHYEADLLFDGFMSPKQGKLQLEVNENMDVMYMLLEKDDNYLEDYIWCEKDECYIRSFYDEMMGKPSSDNKQFTKVEKF